MARFLATRVPGPAWSSDRGVREQRGWDAHAEFMDGLAEEGFVRFGGPVGPKGGAAHVVEALSEEAVVAKLDLDPWTGDGVLRTASIDPWTVWLGGDGELAAVSERGLHLVGYAAGPAWVGSRLRREQPGWESHAAFMDALVDDGVVVFGGPLDEQRALVVVALGGEDDVRARLAADPWVAGGILVLQSVETWTLWLVAEVSRDPGARRR